MPAPDFVPEIAALEKALARGELTVETGTDRITYKTTQDLVTALTYFQTRASNVSGTGGRVTYASFAGE